MSIRFIGLQSYVPLSPGNYSKGNTKVIKISTLPDQHQQKSYKMNKYRQQLDKQVQELKKKKLKQKLQQKQQDQKRQRLFYQSLQIAKRHKHHNQSTSRNNKNYHMMSINNQKSRVQYNPQYDWLDQDEDNFHFQSRLAHIGKNKIKLDVPVFQSRSDLVNDEENYNQISLQRKRKMMLQQMDRSLLDAHMAIQRSKGSSQIDAELDRLRRRLRTQDSRISSQKQYSDELYNLPYRSPKYHSPYRFYHKRQATWN